MRIIEYIDNINYITILQSDKGVYVYSSICICAQYFTHTIDLFTPPLPPPPYVADSTASVSSCLR